MAAADSPRPFLDHLEELRSCLIRSLVSVLLGTAAAYQFVDPILRLLTKPVGRLIFLSPTEAFFARLKVAAIAGIFIAVPYVLSQIWRFIVVALTPVERRAIFWILPSSYLLFLAGACFSFFLLIPSGVKFLLGYGSDVLAPAISVESYLNFVGTLTLMLGIIFQMPLVTFFLARLGIIDASWLAAKRRYAVVILYAACAVITPGPDPVTSLILLLPTYLLYEISILTSRAVDGRLDSHSQS